MLQANYEWETVVYGKTEDQLIMTEQARRYLSNYTTAGSTSRALVLWLFQNELISHPAPTVDFMLNTPTPVMFIFILFKIWGSLSESIYVFFKEHVAWNFLKKQILNGLQKDLFKGSG